MNDFRNGKPRSYGGGVTKDEFVKWVTKNSAPSSTKVDCDTLKSYVGNAKYILAYFGSLEHALFRDVHLPIADLNAAVKFFHVTDDAACAKEHLVKSGQGLSFIKNFDNERVHPYTGAADIFVF